MIAHKTQARDRVSNGADLLPGVDGRCTAARRFRGLVVELEGDAGPALSSAARLQIRTVAMMQLHAEDLTARSVRGERVDAEQLTRAVNGALRALRGLRSGRKAPDAPSPLDAHLQQRAAREAAA
jgi:hypothetical protein